MIICSKFPKFSDPCGVELLVAPLYVTEELHLDEPEFDEDGYILIFGFHRIRFDYLGISCTIMRWVDNVTWWWDPNGDPRAWGHEEP